MTRTLAGDQTFSRLFCCMIIIPEGFADYISVCNTVSARMWIKGNFREERESSHWTFSFQLTNDFKLPTDIRVLYVLYIVQRVQYQEV